jgi:hypothetical protein
VRIDEEKPTRVDVRPGQRWEFTDPSGTTHSALVVRVSETLGGVRYVFLRQSGSRGPKRVPLRRLERQLEGARLVAERDAAQPSDATLNRRTPRPAEAEQAPPRKTLHQPTMSAADRRDAIARARWLHASGRPLREIAQALSVVPEIVEGWLSDSPSAK